MEIIPLGDSALVVHVREQFDDAPDETLDEVLRVFQLLQHAAIPGVIELAPAYTSIAVFFDPIAVLKTNGPTNGAVDELATRIRNAIIPAYQLHRRRRAASTAASITTSARPRRPASVRAEWTAPAARIDGTGRRSAP